ncbi:MAG: STAS domain-containing protein [Rhodobacteraceae bacterium]|nr:STAS domain-containing protein [Paracoccaceae bacterium]
MNLSSQEAAEICIVSVNEPRIDAAVAIQFKDRMRDKTDDAGARVVLDLGQVNFIDSSGLGAIVAAMKQLGPNRRLDLAALNPNVDKVFRLTRMDRVFHIFDTLEDALAQ